MRGFLLGTLPAFLLAGGSPQALPLRTTLSAETLRLPQREALGLVGLSSTVDLGPFYFGPGLYGAARGQRGGFFTFGLEGGLRGVPLQAWPFEWEAGLFVGGGGGAGAPQGGGLMLRPHLGAALLLGRFRLGAELSRIRFPNGGIDSTQAAMTLAFTSDHLWVPEGGWGPAFQESARWVGTSLEIRGLRVAPSASSRMHGGAPQRPFLLAGISRTTDLVEPFFRFLAADGAAGGSSAGYAQALAGLGLHIPLTGPIELEARLGAGMGGGGGVNTGGGFLVSGEGSLILGTGAWRAAAGVGFLRAPGGTFDGRTLTFRLSHRSAAAVPSATGSPLPVFDRTNWRAGSGFLVYHRAQRRYGPDRPIQMMTLRADRSLGKHVYLSSEAGSATGGHAGGYATGLAGLGGQTPPWAGQRLFAEAALGAGGGGGLRSGGGLLGSVRVGWRLELPLGLGLEAAAGKVHALRGDLHSTTYGMSLHLRFEALER